MTFLLLILILVLYSLYKRYYPIHGVHCVALNDLDLDKINILDVRDFIEAYKNPIEGAISIPVAYLKRNLDEIPNRNLHVIGLTHIDKNVSIRLLKQKGFQVSGYTIVGHNQKPSKCKNQCLRRSTYGL
jgi:hypothetical protein